MTKANKAFKTDIQSFGQEWKNRQKDGLVSIIIPCFNAEEFLETAVESILYQDYPDIEILLMDDCSMDNTPQIINRLAGIDPRIRPFFAPENIGPFALRNRALLKSSGEFIAFLDSDDIWGEEKLSKSVAALSDNPEAGLCHHLLMRIDAENKPTRMLDLKSEEYAGRCFHLMVGQNGVATTSVMVKRSVFFDTGGFDEVFKFRGDWEMWTRIARKYPFVFIDESLGFYRVHKNNVSGDPDRIKAYAFLVLDKFETCFGLGKDEIDTCVIPARIAVHLEFGLMELTRRRYGPARKHLRQVLSYNPFHFTGLTGLLKTFIYPLLRRS